MSGTIPFTMRPALADLPALPVNQRPKPSTMKTSPADVPRLGERSALTPPSSPPKPENDRASVSEITLTIGMNLGPNPSELPKFMAEQETEKQREVQETRMKLYNEKYELHEELGYGVWSIVYRASEVTEPIQPSAILPPSPPTSPTSGPTSSSRKALAVKKPSRRDAYKILEKEAKILTYLHSHNKAPSYLVFFHGFDLIEHSLVLDAVPLSLESYAKAARKRPLATKTMFDPVMGAEEWAELTKNLITGLVFLHDKGCVHGDIKPANILLRTDEDGKVIPLYCDFSSSRIVSSNTADLKLEEVSAVTAEYTSPELLGSLHKRKNERAVATFTSDIFALAVVLLFAALGESPYAGARLDIQKLGMAKEGVPLDYARGGEQASRVMKGRAVERALKGGLAKDPKKRLEVQEWRGEVQAALAAWKQGGWSRGG